MKIFKFNPETGKRGEQIGNARRASWTGQSVRYQVEQNMIEPIEAVIPKSGYSQEWVLHVDAGITDKDMNDVSYLGDEWICFCLGEFRVGQGGGCWSWVVLPPKDLIKPISQEVKCQ